jgi:hypothetical protein
MSLVEDVVHILESMGAEYALIGGRAVGARGYPRMTLDYDFLTSDARILRLETWKDLRGASIDPRKGEQDDPLAGVAHIESSDGGEVDIVLAKWKWEAELIERSERLNVGSVEVPVPTISDLILLKLAAGGPMDLQDVISLVATDRENLVREVDTKVSSVLPDVVAVWERLKLSIAE